MKILDIILKVWEYGKIFVTLFFYENKKILNNENFLSISLNLRYICIVI